MFKRLLALPVLFAAIQTTAQDSTKTSQLDEVVVTANKSPKKQSETGKVVTTISSQTLQRSIGKDLAQVLNEQAGLIVNGANSNPGKDKSIFLRGAKNDYTVILINGIPITDPSGVGGAFDLRMIPVEQIERIEILKGAQSTLYGSNAIAGVINIITQKGPGKPVQLSGNASIGSYNTKRASASLSGNTEKVGYLVSFNHFETDGISEAADTTAAKNFDKDGYQLNGFNATFNAEVIENVRIKPFFRYSYYNGKFDGGSYTDGRDEYASSLLSAGTIIEYEHRFGTLTAQYAFDQAHREFKSDFPSTFDGKSKIAEIFSTFNVHDHVQLLAGVDYRKQRSIDALSDPKNPFSEITSPYLNIFVRNIYGLNFEAGGRYNKHSEFGDKFTYSINPSFVINRSVKLFASYATAFRAPSLSELYGQWGANKNLKPEESYTYEGGVQAVLGKQFNLRLVAFNRNITNAIIYGATGYINLNKQKDHGFEIEPSFSVNESLNVKLFYAFVDGKVTTLNAISGKDTSYFNLVRRPKHAAGATISYQVTPAFFISTTGQYNDKRTDLNFDANTWLTSEVRLKSYFILNAYAEYGFFKNQLKVFADVKNITDAKFQEVYGYSTPGFNINAGIAFKL